MPMSVTVGDITIGDGTLALISGPCVIESREFCLEMGDKLSDLSAERSIPMVFKASYDKANRSSCDSFRGLGIDEGLDILAEVRQRTGLPITTDVHTPEEAERVGKVVDIVQIPAFLCRQTDLLMAAAATGKVVNVKKGQFLAPWDMEQVLLKLRKGGCEKVLFTERGASFGYNNLVADMRSLLVMRELGVPVIFDATHSVQRPGAGGTHSSGDGCWAPALARAAVAVGCDGVFVETHINPAEALSDRDNAIALWQVGALWEQLRQINAIVS